MTHARTTCSSRYAHRVFKWSLTGYKDYKLRHFGWWLLHNSVSHPLLAIPNPVGLWLHDWSSQKLNLFPRRRPSAPPEVERWGWWLFHNVAVHFAIGVLPCDLTFRIHDATAKQMNVPDWV